MRFLSLAVASLSLVSFSFQTSAQSIEVVPQVALPGATVLVADDKSKAPRFLPAEALYSPRGALEWRTTRGEILKVVPLGVVATSGYVTIAPSPDGILVAVLATPEAPLQWKNAWSGETVREFSQQGMPFLFSPDGRLFASTSGGKITVREVKSSREVVVITSTVALTDNAKIQFSPDSTELVVYNERQPLEVFEVASGRKLFGFDDEGRVFGVRFLPGGVFVALRVKGKPFRDSFSLRRLDRQGRETQKQSITAPNTDDPQFRFAGDTVFIEAGYEKWSNDLSYFAFENGRPLTRVAAARWNALAPKPLPPARLGAPIPLRFVRAVGGKTLVSDGHNYWNGVTGKRELSLSPAVTRATAFDVSRDAKLIAAAGRSRNGVLAGVWTRANRGSKHQRARKIEGRIEASDFGESGDVWASDTQFSPDSRLLATASGLVSQAPPLIVQNALSGKIAWQWKWRPEHNGFGSIAGPRIDFAPDGRSLAFLDNITEYDAQKNTFRGTYGRLRRAESRNGEVAADTRTLPSFALDFAPDGSTLAVSTQRGQLKNYPTYSYFVAESFAVELRDPKSLELRKSIAAPIALQQVRWSKDSRKIAAIGSDTAIYLLDVASQRRTKLSGHAQVPRDVTWLSATKLVSCGDDGRLIFWQVGSEQPLATTHLFRPAARVDGRAYARASESTNGPVEYLATTPEGDFSASPGALPFIRFRDNRKLLGRTFPSAGRNNPSKVRAAISASR